jgi:7,8-dihydropterin-6-yl-methyl-4-(beta-D-ribofuranosyl)aminobenzene 5'-phosphate synthase
MPAGTGLKKVDRVEITTVIDNFVEMLAMDDTEIVHRFVPVKNEQPSNDWVVAEHGFSTIIRTIAGESRHTIMMDFGKSAFAVPYNLEAMDVDLHSIEALSLSHGHVDHFGGLLRVLEKIPSKPIPLVLHPDGFLTPKYFKFPNGVKVVFPSLEREAIQAAGAEIVEETSPKLLADGTLLFLGQIERTNDFEKGMPLAFMEIDGREVKDDTLDDTALVANLKDKGLVILTGCAHAGIINTINYARKITGVERVHCAMGGFHLVGPQTKPLIERTLQEMRSFSPDYVVPCHCTGRKAVEDFQRAMPENFILNESGTTLTFD